MYIATILCVANWFSELFAAGIFLEDLVILWTLSATLKIIYYVLLSDDSLPLENAVIHWSIIYNETVLQMCCLNFIVECWHEVMRFHCLDTRSHIYNKKHIRSFHTQYCKHPWILTTYFFLLFISRAIWKHNLKTKVKRSQVIFKPHYTYCKDGARTLSQVPDYKIHKNHFSAFWLRSSVQNSWDSTKLKKYLKKR